jgi:hypothetical protein
MSQIGSAMRNCLAAIQPLTGDRSSGTITVTATGADVSLSMGTWAYPIVGGQVQTDRIFKAEEGPNADKSWTITSDGVDVDFISNVGGEKHNVSDLTQFVFLPPLSGIDSAVASGAFSGATNPTFYGGIKETFVFEHVNGPAQQIDIERMKLRGTPAVIVVWNSSEPSDGVMSSSNNPGSHCRGRFSSSFRELLTMVIIVSKSYNEAARSEEGLYIMDKIARYLNRRQSADGCLISSPSPIMVQTRNRVSIPKEPYQKHYIYSVTFSIENAYTMTDDRSYSDWNIANIDILKPDEDVGDYTIINDIQSDMSP